MDTYTLHLEWPVADVLAYALLRTIDDLEARAIVAEYYDPEIGAASAVEYRDDIRRLQTVLGQIAPEARGPDATQAAVHWLDGTYTVADGRPVPLMPLRDVLALVEETLDLMGQDGFDPHEALIDIHEYLTAHALFAMADGTWIVSTSPEPSRSDLLTPQAAHRLAPGCEPAPDRAQGTGTCRC